MLCILKGCDLIAVGEAALRDAHGAVKQNIEDPERVKQSSRL